MTVFMGDDWAEDHHDVHLMDDDGKKLASSSTARRARWDPDVP